MFGQAFRTAILAGAAAFVATQALAHAELVTSDPRAESTVIAPEIITLTFSEDVVPAFSGFELMMLENEALVPVDIKVSDDRRTITGRPEEHMRPGDYKIVWRVAADDGHRITGEISFTVE